MQRDYQQIQWDQQLADQSRQLIRLALAEDLETVGDLTTQSLIAADSKATADLVAREAGVVAGLKIAEILFDEMQVDIQWRQATEDGDCVSPGQTLAEMKGSARDLLTAERTLLNFLGRMSGVATNTQRYVRKVDGLKARVYDTRKTTPGWRGLEKYAVHRGGGRNHRLGLFDAILIKDNHLAQAARGAQKMSPAQAVATARDFLAKNGKDQSGCIVEVEVDTLEQLDNILSVPEESRPDIVLLDNMSLDELRDAVARRNAAAPAVQLEASGGVRLDTIRGIAETGVDRVSVGALTHSAINFDIGLDWQ